MNIDQLNRDYGIRDQLKIIEGNGGFPMIEVDTGTARAIVSIYAGQILSYRPKEQAEDLLFLSKSAYYAPNANNLVIERLFRTRSKVPDPRAFAAGMPRSSPQGWVHGVLWSGYLGAPVLNLLALTTRLERRSRAEFRSAGPGLAPIRKGRGGRDTDLCVTDFGNSWPPTCWQTAVFKRTTMNNYRTPIK